MISTPTPSFISKADGNEVVVKTQEASSINFLLNLGFHKKENSDDQFTRTVKDDQEKGNLFIKIRDEDICFSRGKEWNPAEVFEWLRDENLVSGKFKSIAWKNSNEFIIRDE